MTQLESLQVCTATESGGSDGGFVIWRERSGELRAAEWGGSLGSCTAPPVLDNPQSVAQTQQGQVGPGPAHGMWLECVEFVEWHLCVWDECAGLGALEKNACGSWCHCKCHGIVIPAVCEC